MKFEKKWHKYVNLNFKRLTDMEGWIWMTHVKIFILNNTWVWISGYKTFLVSSLSMNFQQTWQFIVQVS